MGVYLITIHQVAMQRYKYNIVLNNLATAYNSADIFDDNSTTILDSNTSDTRTFSTNRRKF